MTPKEFIEREEKGGKRILLFTVKPFQSRETCCLWRDELAKLLQEYADIKINKPKQHVIKQLPDLCQSKLKEDKGICLMPENSCKKCSL